MDNKGTDDSEKKDKSDSEAETEEKKEDEENVDARPKRNKKPEEEKKAEVDEDGVDGEDLKDDAEFTNKMGTMRYLTFAEFAKKMSLFNPRTGIDDKIQFYFRIFDVDEDKKINNDDLNKVMKMLFGSKLNDEEMTTLASKVFEEVL